ncbi:orotidine-5'-phosphate decarboxylase [Candidatus Pacearchaeota archaeon]|nr:orotidine-5'-phosphate decarboxylase [Candidatus Pacearchaeota archaeon]
MTLTDKEQEARKRVCLALDVRDVNEALNLSGELSDYVGTFKVGKQLHTVACNQGVPILKEIYSRGGSTFLDLKLHDTPNTAYETAYASVVDGVYVFNVHVAGGEEMCKKAVQGAEDGAGFTQIERPKVIGVTALTSLSDEDLEEQGLGISYDDLVRRRTELARNWGLDGIVCPANKAGDLEKEFGSDFIYVTPGIKWAGKQGAGQKQLYTPDRAVQDCSNSILVVGSAITKAENRRETAYEILKAMAPNMSV